MEDLKLIVESIDRICANAPLYENEIVVPKTNERIIIEIYDAKNDATDKEFISKNRQQIWQFFDDGYIAAGLGHFTGCYNEKSVKRNTVLLKVAREKVSLDIITMSIYTESPAGIKCVGLTITTEETYRSLAMEALRFIIKEDISKFKEYYWCECDGVIKHYYEKFGATKLPNVYLPAIFKDKFERMDIEYVDEYDYIRVIGKGTENEIAVKKCLFGFPNKEILDDYIKKANTTLEKIIQEIKESQSQNESTRYFTDDVELAFRVLDNYAFFRIESEIYTFTEFEIDKIKECFKLVDDFRKRYLDLLPAAIGKWKFNSTYENTVDILDCYTILKPYTFDDELICADFEKDNAIEQQKTYQIK